MKSKNTATKRSFVKPLLYLLIGVSCFFVGQVFAQTTIGATTGTGLTLGGVADQITGSFFQLGKLMIAISYLAGIGFCIASMFKFKQHKDNPTQIPLGTPLALLTLGIILVFMPSLFGPAGTTLFGSATQGGGFTGTGAGVLPNSGATSQ
ncbi:MAG TPA: type IV secretion protein IcmD [Gammaproteobacteria bacterium]|nr:type IV secretion protein IcmD [Gammaproteobacteria bacterium]